MTLFVFDLDDTLVCGKRYTVPRQTFHALRSLKASNHTLVIVTYNPLGYLVAANKGLLKFIDKIIYAADAAERSELVLMALFAFQQNLFPFYAFVYLDDRRDNIQNVQKHFPSAQYVHVTHPLRLHAQIKECKHDC